MYGIIESLYRTPEANITLTILGLKAFLKRTWRIPAPKMFCFPQKTPLGLPLHHSTYIYCFSGENLVAALQGGAQQ